MIMQDNMEIFEIGDVIYGSFMKRVESYGLDLPFMDKLIVRDTKYLPHYYILESLTDGIIYMKNLNNAENFFSKECSQVEKHFKSLLGYHIQLKKQLIKDNTISLNQHKSEIKKLEQQTKSYKDVLTKIYKFANANGFGNYIEK